MIHNVSRSKSVWTFEITDPHLKALKELAFANKRLPSQQLEAMLEAANHQQQTAGEGQK